MTTVRDLTTVPLRSQPATFSQDMEYLLTNLPGWTGEVNAVAGEVNADKSTAVDSAATAVAKASEAVAAAAAAARDANAAQWVSGTTYTIGTVVWSPSNYLSYTRKTNGAGTTDPMSDPTNWAPRVPTQIYRQTRTSNTILARADDRAIIDITSGTFTQTFSACSTLGNGWSCIIRNSGNGDITLDPDGSETINGLTSYVVYSGKSVLVQCDGSSLLVALDSSLIPSRPVRRLPIFSTEAARSGYISSQEVIYNASVNFCSQMHTIVSNGTIFVAIGTDSNYVKTTTDGRTLLSRLISSTASKGIATDGSGFLIVASSTGGYNKYSADGITWSSVADTPGAADTTTSSRFAGIPGGKYIVRSGVDSYSAYLTINNGTSWSTETMPAENIEYITSINGMFFARSYYNKYTYYTSTTGTTGSWTSRTLPASCDYVYNNIDGSIIARVYESNTTTFRKTTDGINWIDTGVYPAMINRGIQTIEGVHIQATNGSVKTYSGGLWASRDAITALGLITQAYGNNRWAKVGNLVIAILGEPEHISDTGILIDPTAVDAATAVFGG